MRLKTCFGCVSLQSGTIVIGSVSLAGSLLSAISSAPHIVDFEENVPDDFQCLARMLLTGILTYVLVIGAMAGLMIYGAYKRNPEFVFPWVALSTADALAWISFSFGFVVISPTVFTIKWFFNILMALCVAVGLRLYVWLIVFSFYKQLVAEKYLYRAPIIKDKVFDPPINVYNNV